MKRVLVLLASGLLLAGCGGVSGPAGPALQQTADKLGSIKSADLTFEVELMPRDGKTFGYSVTGPFALATPGELPKMDVEYTQRANGQSETVRLVSDGTRAVAVVRGAVRELTPEQLDSLRGAASGLGGSGTSAGLERLRIDRWLVDPKLSDGPDGTDKITGDLDVVAMTNGLLELGRSFGAASGSGPIEGEDADRLRDAVDSASFEILTGKDDRLLRKLALDVSLGIDVPEELRRALGQDVIGADISFVLGLDRPNEPVEVELPS